MKQLTEKEQVIQALRGPQFNRNQHGSLWDRGTADNYYSRGPNPHWYPQGSYNGVKIDNLTQDEIAEYMAGYDYNERYGDKKSWD